MEANIPSYKIIKCLLKKEDREVLIVESSHFSSSDVQTYVLKKIISKEKPMEFIFHRNLSTSYPDFLKYIKSWKESPFYCYIMEYCKGGDLHTYIKSKSGKIDPPSDVLRWCLQLANMVSLFHMNNLCHRDLKPQNIFITEDRTLKIGDFGTCKSYSREKGKSLNTVVGTIPYMSFEIIKNYRGEKLKNNPIRDDIFALGLIFMEIATSNFYRRFNEIDNDTAVNTINNAFSKLNYPSDFIDLVKKMLCSPIDDYIEINQVIEILINLTPKTLEYNYFTEISYLTTQEKIINWFDYKESDTLTTRDCQSTELLINRKEKEKKRRKIRKGFSIITFSFVMIFPTKRCQICKIIINNDRLELDCKHSYHSQCIVLLYQQTLEQTTCKIERFRCENKSCRSFIKFEKFQEIGTLSQKAKIKASLLYWAYTPYFCFVCSFETDFFYLNDKLKDKTIVCPRCKKKFCSFCSGEGSHVLTCKAFDNLRNGRSCFDRLA